MEQCKKDEVIAEFKAQGGYFMTQQETKEVCKLLFKNGHTMNAKFVGKEATVIAKAANIQVPSGTRVLIGEQTGVGEGNPLSYEKLTTVLGFYTVNNAHEACELCIKLLQNAIGHTMSMHTQNKDIVTKFSAKPASRILVNTGNTQGGTGASTGLAISFTLGCGTWGGSSVSENVSPMHLINIKRVVYGIHDCETLVSLDKSFDYPELNDTFNTFNGKGITKSPSDYVSSFEQVGTSTTTTCEPEITKQEMLDMIQQIVTNLKEVK